MFSTNTGDKPRFAELQSLHRRLIEFWFELKSLSFCKDQYRTKQSHYILIDSSHACITQFYPSLSFISKIEFLNIQFEKMRTLYPNALKEPSTFFAKKETDTSM